MIPYEIDPSLHTAEPEHQLLGDGFSPPHQSDHDVLADGMAPQAPPSHHRRARVRSRGPAMATHPVEPEPLPPGPEPTAPNPSHLPVEPEFGPTPPPVEPEDPRGKRPNL